MIPAFVGLAIGLFRGPRFLRFLIPVLVCAIYFNSIVPNWFVGASFSERRTVDYSVFFAVGLCSSFHSFQPCGTGAGILASGIALASFNWLLMLRYFTHDLPEYGYVSYSELYLGTLSFPFRIAIRLFS